MALEKDVNYISDLDPNAPVSNDPKSDGDDHIRNSKRAMKQSFPFVTGPVPIAHDQFASKAYVQAAAFSAALPAQPGGAVKYDLITQAGVAAWAPRSNFADMGKLAELHAIALSF